MIVRQMSVLLLGAVVVLGACSSDSKKSEPASTVAASSSTVAAPATAPPTYAPTTDSPTSDAPTTDPAAAVPDTAPTKTTIARSDLGPVTVTGPITAGKGQANATRRDLKASGYTEEEYFIEGDATSYAPVGALAADGKWSLNADKTAPYKTRIIVRRPTAAKFSGTVVVEWLNVSAGADGDPEWGYTSDELVREGHAWVGVSAQAIGVNGGASILGETTPGGGGLVNADPDRYGSLAHPGDAFAYDIFTQAATSLVAPDGPSPLGDLAPKQIVGAGESQSAFFMTSYINGVQPLSHRFDGFLVHSRGGGAPGFDGGGIGDSARGTAGVDIRDDSDVPVMVFQTETDLTVLGYASANQDDSAMVKVWQTAGTAHADEFLLVEVYGVGDGGSAATLLNCTAPLNSGPHHEVLQAALHRLIVWMNDGTEPPVSPRLQLAADGSPALARDEYGNALGGIRTPLVDVPVATLSGDPVAGAGGFCFLFGFTTPLDAAVLQTLYPTSKDYLDAFTAKLDETVAAGFILEADAGRLLTKAEKVAATMGR